MRKLVITGFIFACILLFLSCEKQGEQNIMSNSILAGQKDNSVLYQDFEPDLQITLVNITVDGIPSTGFSGEINLDLDLDGKDDVKFYSYYGMGCPAFGCFQPVEGCKVSAIPYNKQIEICLVPKSKNDPINADLEWTQIWMDAFLSGYTPKWTNTEEIKNNSWNTPGLYMAVRKIQLNDTIYGWVGMEIDDYYKLKIRETGLMK